MKKIGPKLLYEILNIEIKIKNFKNQGLCILGKRGSGKSEIIQKFCIKNDIPILIYRLGNLEEASELTGLVIPKIEDQNIFTITSVPELIREIEKLNNKNENKPIVIFFDEVTQVKPGIQKILMQILSDRLIGLYKIPNNVKFIFAGNLPDEASFIEKLESPLSNRMTIVYYENNVNDWIEYMLSNKDFNPAIVSFIKYNSDLFNKEISEYDIEYMVSSRQLEVLSKYINHIENEIEDKDLRLKMIDVYACGRLSEAVGSKFMNFYENFMKSKIHIILEKIENANIEDLDKILNENLVSEILNDDIESYNLSYSIINCLNKSEKINDLLKYLYVIFKFKNKGISYIFSEIISILLSKKLEYVNICNDIKILEDVNNTIKNIEKILDKNNIEVENIISEIKNEENKNVIRFIISLKLLRLMYPNFASDIDEYKKYMNSYYKNKDKK